MSNFNYSMKINWKLLWDQALEVTLCWRMNRRGNYFFPSEAEEPFVIFSHIFWRVYNYLKLLFSKLMSLLGHDSGIRGH